MTPGEVKGYLRQIICRKEISKEEKEAVGCALQAVELMLSVAPVISKATKELENVKDHSGAISVVDTGEIPEPNTGWVGDHVLPYRKGPK